MSGEKPPTEFQLAIEQALKEALATIVESSGLPGALLFAVLPDGTGLLVSDMSPVVTASPVEILELALEGARKQELSGLAGPPNG